ncbi:nuclease [candidate division KSB1 bacterium 4572_119]|nr:MAG: nuclease [candidate division KSB1 bacterium 4572_119]
METNLYHYRAYVTEVYDGDTCTVNIDLGLHVWQMDEKIRLARIDAPELRGEERPQGLVSRDFLRDLILDKNIILETIKDKKGKYGRYLGEIWIEDESGQFYNVNDRMVADGYAEPYA